MANEVSDGPTTPMKRTNSSAPKLSASAFPVLPSASSSKLKPTLNGNKSLRNIAGNSTLSSAWSPAREQQENAGESALNDPALNEGADEINVARSKKKKGKEKVTLFTIGTFPA